MKIPREVAAGHFATVKLLIRAEKEWLNVRLLSTIDRAVGKADAHHYRSVRVILDHEYGDNANNRNYTDSRNYNDNSCSAAPKAADRLRSGEGNMQSFESRSGHSLRRKLTDFRKRSSDTFRKDSKDIYLPLDMRRNVNFSVVQNFETGINLSTAVDPSSDSENSEQNSNIKKLSTDIDGESAKHRTRLLTHGLYCSPAHVFDDQNGFLQL